MNHTERIRNVKDLETVINEKDCHNISGQPCDSLMELYEGYSRNLEVIQAFDEILEKYRALYYNTSNELTRIQNVGLSSLNPDFYNINRIIKVKLKHSELEYNKIHKIIDELEKKNKELITIADNNLHRYLPKSKDSKKEERPRKPGRTFIKHKPIIVKGSGKRKTKRKTNKPYK